MLQEILFVVIVLVVATLMIVDVARTRNESFHGHGEGQAFDAKRPVAAAASQRGQPRIVLSGTRRPGGDARRGARRGPGPASCRRQPIRWRQPAVARSGGSAQGITP